MKHPLILALAALLLPACSTNPQPAQAPAQDSAAVAAAPAPGEQLSPKTGLPGEWHLHDVTFSASMTAHMNTEQQAEFDADLQEMRKSLLWSLADDGTGTISRNRQGEPDKRSVWWSVSEDMKKIYLQNTETKDLDSVWLQSLTAHEMRVTSIEKGDSLHMTYTR